MNLELDARKCPWFLDWICVVLGTYGYDVATPMLRDVIKLRTNAANHV